MGLMCMKCLEVYSRELIKLKFNGSEEYSFCPKYTCYGRVCEIDEIMIPVIKILQQKNYETDGCCSGHSYDLHEDSNMYIRFKTGVPICKTKTPRHFIMESNRIIRKKYESKTAVELQHEILNTAIDLLKWAESLPKLKKIEHEYESQACDYYEIDE